MNLEAAQAAMRQRRRPGRPRTGCVTGARAIAERHGVPLDNLPPWLRAELRLTAFLAALGEPETLLAPSASLACTLPEAEP